MSMPQIPEEKYRPNSCEVTIDILKSIALEETALSHILNSEGERSQTVIKEYECCKDDASFCKLSESVKLTEKMLNTIIMKEWLLLKKLETAYETNHKLNFKSTESDKHGCKNCNRDIKKFICRCTR